MPDIAKDQTAPKVSPEGLDQPAKHRLVTAFEHSLQEFLIDRESRNLTPKTMRWYNQSLALLSAFLTTEHVTAPQDITPNILRRFILHLTERGHNAGGVKNIYGAVKAFITWYADENAPPGWPNPLRKVRTPKVPEEPLEPANLEHIKAMLAVCPARTYTGDRDRALLLFLLDSGVRHQELTDLTVGDVDLRTGTVLVRSGKGRKPRTTFIGAKTRKALLTYLNHWPDPRDTDALWATGVGTALTYGSIRQVLRRRAKQAGVPEPSLHSFRRAFAIAALRAGCDLITLQRLLGHSSLAVIGRYLKQVDGDLQAAHAKVGPVDRLLGKKGA